MPLSPADILFRRSANMTDTAATNGGRMASGILNTGIKNAVFPDVRNAERLAGSDKWRKVFLHFAPMDSSQALDVHVIPWAPTIADDRVRVHAGTQTDTQATIAATPGNAYGAANANTASLPAGSTSVAVTLESAAETIFRVGDTVYITDKDAVTSSTGAEEYTTLSAVSVTGTTATLTFTALQYAYTETATAKIRVASVIPLGDVLPTVAAGTLTSAAGTFDDTKVQVVPRSTIDDIWTLTFTSATAYSVSGAVTGALAISGSISGNFSPTNVDFGGPYFTLPTTAFGGTFAPGDTATFTTHPAARGLWLRRIVPAGCTSFASDEFTLAVDCETA